MNSGASQLSKIAVVGLLMAFFATTAMRDIDRPFTGLHGWDAALGAWAARSHVNYGLAYTKGLATLAVGHPPPEVPERYLNHPQLGSLLDGAAMAILGIKERALRVSALVVVCLSLPFLFALIRRLFDEETAILSVLLYILFPITQYFYAATWQTWVFPASILAYWCYLRLIGEIGDDETSRRLTFFGLGVALFVLPQLAWPGFSYAAAIGLHYVARCWRRRRFPDVRLFLVLLFTPFVSLFISLGVLLWGRGWDLGSLFALYRFRSTIAAESGRTVAGWLVTQYEHIVSNFTFAVVLVVAAYFAYAFARGLWRGRTSDLSAAQAEPGSRSFHHAWLFLGPGLLNLLVFREQYWVHQFQYLWFSVGFAIATALALLRLRDLLVVRHRLVANGVFAGLLAVIVVSSAQGVNLYHGTVWRSPVEVDMFQRLQRAIPPGKGLLINRSYRAVENPAKPPHYRPEVAWYLDRPMKLVTTLAEVEELSATGQWPRYLVDIEWSPAELIDELKERYEFEVVPGHPYEAGPPEKISFPEQVIFNLEIAANATFDRFFDEATAMVQAGDYVAAERFLRQALSVLATGDRAAHASNNLGWVVLEQGRHEEALEAFRRALELNPGSERARANIRLVERQLEEERR